MRRFVRRPGRWLPAALSGFLLACASDTSSSTPDATTELETDAGAEVDMAPDPDGFVPSEVTDTQDTTPPDGDTTSPAGPFQLIVKNGYGSGSYLPGEVVHVFALVDPYDAVVTGWTSSTDDVAPPAEWHVIVTMPAEDTTLTPTLTQVPLPLEEQTMALASGDKRVLLAVPEAPRGVVFIFHGTDGSADMIGRPSAQTLARLAFLRGYIVAVTEAHEVTTGDPGPDGKRRWNADPDLASNLDLQDIEALAERLVADGALAASAPRFAIGMSNGGAFAITVGAALPGMTAVTSFCAPGREAAYESTTTPSQWLMCENDTNETVSAERDRWEDGSKSLRQRGIATDYGVLAPSPVFRGRFARIAEVNPAASSSAVDELRANGFLDEDGMLVQPPAAVAEAARAAGAAWPAMAAIVTQSSARDVLGELEQAYADHQLYDDFAARCLDFLEAQVP